MKSFEDKLLGAHGWIRIDDTGTHTGPSHYGLVPALNTVIATWTSNDVNGDTHDLLDWFKIKTKTITVNDPALIIPEAWTYAPQVVKLTSGSVNLLRKP